jgi:hypothetical protein
MVSRAGDHGPSKRNHQPRFAYPLASTVGEEYGTREVGSHKEKGRFL